MTRPVLHLDLETRSRADLRKTGLYRYAEDPSTDVILACWCVDDGRIYTWRRGEPLPPELAEALREGRVVAHNAAFERILLRDVLGPRYGWPQPPLEAWDCTMARARAAGLPGSLDGALGAMGAPFGKDREGAALMLRMCRPRKVENDGTVSWWEDKERIDRLAAYCAQDVQGERWLDKRIPHLAEQERQVWLADQRLNDRGVPIDVDFCRDAIAVSDEARLGLDREMRQVTGGAVPKASNINKLRTWLLQQGVRFGEPTDDDEEADEELDEATPEPEMRRNDLERMLAGSLPPHARRAIEIRLEAGKSSVKKVNAMLGRVQADGRVRGMLSYYGAATGRWSAAGSGIQLQNLPRDTVKDWEGARASVAAGAAAVEVIEGPPLAVLSKMLRGTICAPAGRELVYADLSSVEARGVAWLAGQDDLVEAFASGAKMYESMAADVFDMTVEEVIALGKDSFQRFIGKGLVLGCLAENTEVLTDEGWIPIQYVTTTHKLWDGEEWVGHQGVISSGLKKTLPLCGLWLTPDHRVWCGTQWMDAQSLERDASILSQALATAAASCASLDISAASGVGSAASLFGATAGAPSSPWTPITSKPSGAPAATPALSRRASARASGIGATRTSCRTMTSASACSTGSLRASLGAITLATAAMSTTAPGASKSTNLGGRIGAPSFPTSRRCPTGKTPSARLTGSKLIGGTSQATYGSPLGPRTARTGDLSVNSSDASPSLRRRCQTYDIAHSGPRNRFTVRTAAGPLIVHNCGYGMGAPKFAATCAKQGREVSDEIAERGIRTFRTRFPRIPALWYGLEEAAIAAVKDPSQSRPAAGGKVTFGMFKRWLVMNLPTGSRIFYRNPRIVWDDRFQKDALAYDGTDSKTKRWGEQRTYGGRLTENAVQRICRDIIAFRLPDLEAAGYEPILLVHDETITETDAGRGSREELVELMCRLPAGLAGFPLAAEGAKPSSRYSK